MSRVQEGLGDKMLRSGKSLEKIDRNLCEPAWTIPCLDAVVGCWWIEVALQRGGLLLLVGV